MIKLQYLLRSPFAEPAVAFRVRVLALASKLLDRGPVRLKVTLTSQDPPHRSIVPYRRERLALISLWTEAARIEGWNVSLSQVGASEGYRVRESVPRAYCRDWPDGTATPGLGMLTLLHRRRGLSDDEFLRRWHEGHSVTALKVHPLWNYVRNVVEAAVLRESPVLCGIVEEQFRTERELLSPVALFGGWRRMLPNMLHVLLDVRGFLDLATLENYVVTEHWLRS